MEMKMGEKYSPKSWVDHEKAWIKTNRKAYIAACRNTDKLKDFWLLKPWLSTEIRTKVPAFLESNQGIFDRLPSGINFHVILYALVYWYWRPDIPKIPLGFKRLRRPSSEWKITFRRIDLAISELKNNIIPVLNVNGSYEEKESCKTWAVPWGCQFNRTVEDLIRVKRELLNLKTETNNFKMLKDYGLKKSGRLPYDKENVALLMLGSYFDDKTGSPQWGQLADILSAASDIPGIDEPRVIRRVKKMKERVLNRFNGIVQSWRHTLQELGVS